MRLKGKKQREQALRRKIMSYIESYRSENGTAPAKCEICRRFGISWNYVRKILGDIYE